MSKESRNTGEANGFHSILLPGAIATVVGGAAAYFGTTPEITGLWGLAAAGATGIATGYGAKWGGALFGIAGMVGGATIGLISGAGLTAAFSNRWNRTGNAVAGAAVGAGGGAVLFGIAGAVAGQVAGGMLAYHVAKSDIDEWARSHAGQQHSSVEQIQPSRLGQNSTFQHNEKAYQMVFQNG